MGVSKSTLVKRVITLLVISTTFLLLLACVYIETWINADVFLSQTAQAEQAATERAKWATIGAAATKAQSERETITAGQVNRTRTEIAKWTEMTAIGLTQN